MVNTDRKYNTRYIKWFFLETDAADIGLAAVLKQEYLNIAYISRVLKGSEKNYKVTEKKTLAALCAIDLL